MQNLSPSIRHLRDLIAIPSVNPMGRDDLPPEIVGEHAVAEHLSRALGKLGLDAALVGEGGRTSVVAEARATNAMDTLLVASHIDTVPVDGAICHQLRVTLERHEGGYGGAARGAVSCA